MVKGFDKRSSRLALLGSNKSSDECCWLRTSSCLQLLSWFFTPRSKIILLTIERTLRKSSSYFKGVSKSNFKWFNILNKLYVDSIQHWDSLDETSHWHGNSSTETWWMGCLFFQKFK